MPPGPITQNTLFYGDNLDILREHIPAQAVDLIYLDPPFNSNRSYNVLFKDESGHESEAQITAFDDTWHWNMTAEQTYHELVTAASAEVGNMIGALCQFVGKNQMMAYLVMMAARLVELHRVLKPTGSLYLHCDPTASHYLKIVMDAIFSGENFRNEISWKRTFAHGSAQKYGPVHDTILFYSKTSEYLWTGFKVGHNPEYINKHFTLTDEATGKKFQPISLTGAGIRHGESGASWRGINPTNVGRHWALPGVIQKLLGIEAGTVQERLDALDVGGRIYWPKKENGVPRLKWFADDTGGIAISDFWDDIPPIGAQAAERLGYPTQKPLALLERIIQASSNPGDWVLDPFCGCGTTIAAAQKLGRHWLGIDITHLSIALQKYRLQAMFPEAKFNVIGEPEDIGSARQLAQDDRYQFQWWALSLVKAKPLGAAGDEKKGKKGSDKGIDGVINFIDEAGGKPKRVLVQVKSGKVKSGDIRDLRGTVEREGATIGVFITLEPPTKDMDTEAATAGLYHSPWFGNNYPKIQILTIAQLLAGAEIKMPPPYGTFKQAEKVEEKPKATQSKMAM